MKLFILLLLAGCCVLIGYIFSLKYQRRASFFKALVMICQKLDVEINFSRERIKNLFVGFDEKTKRNLAGLDKNYLAYLDSTSPLEQGNLFKGLSFLKEQEKDTIYLFFKSLGRSDLDSQSKELKNFEKRFEEFSTGASGENKKFGSLSIKLGIVAGLMLVVLFC